MLCALYDNVGCVVDCALCGLCHLWVVVYFGLCCGFYYNVGCDVGCVVGCIVMWVVLC